MIPEPPPKPDPGCVIPILPRMALNPPPPIRALAPKPNMAALPRGDFIILLTPLPMDLTILPSP